MAEWLLLSGSSVLTRCEAPDKASATERFRPRNGQRVVSAASFALDTTPTREARPRESPRTRYLRRRAEASARYRQRERAPEQLTVTERNKLPWSAERRRNASTGQRKRWLNDPEGARERSRLMNEAKHGKRIE